MAFHGIQNLYIQETRKYTNWIPSKLENFHKWDTKTNEEKFSNISNSWTTHTNTINSGLQDITSNPVPILWNIGMAAKRRWEQHENNIKAETQSQNRQNFIDSYERMQKLDIQYPITPWSAVDLATRGIWYRNHEKYYQYKQEIAQEEAQKRKNDAFIQQAIMMNFWNNQDKKRNAR